MSRLLILTTPELALGYRLAGATTREVATTQEAHAMLEALLEHQDGVIAVHAPYFNALPHLFRRRLERIHSPLVVPLPAGTGPERADGRRKQLLDLLRQAVGYGIAFGDERTTP